MVRIGKIKQVIKLHQLLNSHSAVSFKAGQDGADATYGHVAFVEKIRSDGSILISQSGTGYSTLFSYQVLSKDQASRLRYVIGK